MRAIIEGEIGRSSLVSEKWRRRVREEATMWTREISTGEKKKKENAALDSCGLDIVKSCISEGLLCISVPSFRSYRILSLSFCRYTDSVKLLIWRNS